jgi:hypothetical protein
MKRKTWISLFLLLAIVFFGQNLHAQDDILFRRYVINSGINGLFYGVAIDLIVEPESPAAAGIPIIAAGTAVMIPILSNTTRTMSPNTLILSSHGRFVGWAHGFSFATLIGGENAWNDNNVKFTVAAAAITSIGLGIVGNSIGKTKDMTEGQASMYSLYGWTLPLAGTLLAASFSESPRVVAGTELVFATGSYFLADRVYKNYQYTRGDARAIQVFTLLNGGLGLGILADRANRNNESRTDLLFPAVGVMAGSLLGQLWLKNVQMTPRQGMNTAYATTGGAIFGLGIGLLTGSDNITPYYTIPYLTGFIAYAAMVETTRRKNSDMISNEDDHESKWNFAFMPQNYFVNSKISERGFIVNGRITGMQPLFSASLRF